MQETTKSAITLLAVVLIGLISILLFIPVYPVMPRSGLDPSWILAANEAVAQKLVFGTDILYTVGPLSSIWTQAYHPATFQLTVIGGSILAVCHAFLAYKISSASHWLWPWVYVISFVFLMESRDALFLFYPLLLTFFIYRVSLPSSHKGCIQMSFNDTALLMLSVSSLGLLPIIKLSFLPLTLISCIIGSILFWRYRRRFISSMMIALPLITMVLFWDITGQEVAALPGYFINNSPVVSGFTPAMSVHYDFMTPALFVFSSFILLYLFYRQFLARWNTNGLLLLVITALFIFMSFKAGFVRHDVHALTASSGIVLAMLLLSSFSSLNYRYLTIACLMTIVTWSVIHHQHSATSFEYYKPLSKQLLAMAKQMVSKDSFNFSFKDSYNLHLADIRRSNPIPKFQGTVDIYPYEQAALIASSNQWSPRPAFQSFTAYTPNLAIANLHHLSGPLSPDNIVFSVNTIDGRYPSMDDGTSWPTLLAKYQLTQVVGTQLILSKRFQSAPIPVMNMLFSKSAKLGEIVDTGIQDGIIYAEIEVVPSLLGRLASILYKPSALKVTVELTNGKVQHHRFISGGAITGFILSPYVADTNDFAKMLQRSEVMNELPVVKRLKIEEKPFNIGMWNHSYSIKLYVLAEEYNTDRRHMK